MTISNEQIENLLCSAFEGGGSAYWIESVTANHAKNPTPLPDGEDIGAFYAAPLTGGSITIEGLDGTYTLDSAALEMGEIVIRAAYPKHWVDIIKENDDAETADVFLQCCLFAELVYA